MAWDDIIIGKGNSGTGATHMFKLGDSDAHGISENRTSYWISEVDLPFEVGMTIFKDTPEGIKLTRLIETKSLKVVNNYLAKLTLSKMKPEHLIQKIKESNDDSFKRGENSKIAEFKKCFNISDKW